MKVLLEGKTYRIEFQHGTNGKDYTICHIREVIGPREATVVAQGLAIRHYLDPPNREVARKVSLRKALDEMFPPTYTSIATMERHSSPLDRARRKLFWDAYLNRKGKLADIVKLTIDTANRIKQTLAAMQGEAAGNG